VNKPLDRVAEVLIASYLDQLGRDFFKRLRLNMVRNTFATSRTAASDKAIKISYAR